MVAVPDEGLDFEKTVGGFERHILEQALRKTGGNKKQAADMLRLKRTTLSAKLRSLEAVACGWLSFVVVLGLLAQLAIAAWWIDSVTSVAILWLLIKEGRKAWAGEECGADE